MKSESPRERQRPRPRLKLMQTFKKKSCHFFKNISSIFAKPQDQIKKSEKTLAAIK
jgi:hypothetical protein